MDGGHRNIIAPGSDTINNSLLENQTYNHGTERLINNTINECHNVLNARQTWIYITELGHFQ